jgi:hypothetical protein
MRKKLKNTRNYDALLEVVKTLNAVFTCLEFKAAASIKSKWNSYCALYNMFDQGLVYRYKRNGKVVLWSLSPFPVEAPKTPLKRVFTSKEYGEYYNLRDPHRMLYRAWKAGTIFKVGRFNGNRSLLWSFDPANESNEYAVKKVVADAIIPSAVTDPFASIFSTARKV